MNEAKEVIDDYFRQFKKLKLWLEQCKVDIERDAFTYSLLGRKRRLENVRSEDKGIASHEIRSGLNFLVQSIASDINLLGAIDAHNVLKELPFKADIFALVHDSILAEVEEDAIDAYSVVIRECVQKDRGISIPGSPVGCDFDIGDDYSFGKFEKKYEL